MICLRACGPRGQRLSPAGARGPTEIVGDVGDVSSPHRRDARADAGGTAPRDAPLWARSAAGAIAGIAAGGRANQDGVQAAGGFADNVLEASLNIHVHVFQRLGPGKAAGTYLVTHLFQPALDCRCILA